MATEAVVATLRQTWDILRDLHVPAALMGGLAMAHWGHIRSTQDVDLLVALTDMRPHALLSRLAAEGYRSKGRAPLDECYDVQIDLLLADSPFDRSAIERRMALPVSALGFAIDVVSCEDLILLKLIAGRILDRVDVIELLRQNRDSLNLNMLQSWLSPLHARRGFVEAWSEAFPGEPSPI
jgi:hypothetical protein